MEISKIVLEYIQVLIWPGIVVFVCVYFKDQVVDLLERLRSAKLPGGISIDLKDEIQEARILSDKAQESITEKKEENKDRPAIRLNEANSRLIDLGFRPSPSGMDMNYYREFAKQDPNIALAGLRIEVDILTKNLAKGFGIQFDENRDSGIRLLRKLFESGSIHEYQYLLAAKVVSLCNQAVHGSQISYEQALSILDSAETLIDDYLAWLSWGFDGNWQP